MKKNKNISIIALRIEKVLKNDFYNICRSFSMTPMRTILILIKRFAEGHIDALPIIEEYKVFKTDEIDRKTQRILRHRIDGKQAYKINAKKKLIVNK